MVSENPQSECPLTVVMPVHNAALYLDRAIRSIVEQSFTDFVFAIYDDASTDDSPAILEAWAARHPRIRVRRGAERLGPVGSSQAAAYAATTEYVARMDADDVAAPDRLRLQMAALRAHPQCVIVGSLYDTIDADDRVLRPMVFARLQVGQPYVHLTILYRRAAFEAVGGYRPGTEYYEDFDLSERLAGLGGQLVIALPLVSVRCAGQHVRLSDPREQVYRALEARFNAGRVDPTGAQLSLFALKPLIVLQILALQRPLPLREFLRRAEYRHPVLAAQLATLIGLAKLSPRLARRLMIGLAQLKGWRSARLFRRGHLYGVRWPDRPVDFGLLDAAAATAGGDQMLR